MFEDIADDPMFHHEDDDRQKQIVCGIKWYPTRYDEVLMLLVEETVAATGAYTTDREYFSTKSEGLYDAPCFGLRTGISYARYLQLKKFFV